jgi:Domain of unknown function (DUF397).
VNWQKSSHSGSNGGSCVEIARLGRGILALRDSKNPSAGHLTVSPQEFRAFLNRIVANAVD